MEEKNDIKDDEIVFEVKHNVFILDTLVQYLLFLFGIAILILLFLIASNEIGVIIVEFIILFAVILWAKALFYRRKNKIFITNRGIGFERRY